jgi:hypothetical protein
MLKRTAPRIGKAVGIPMLIVILVSVSSAPFQGCGGAKSAEQESRAGASPAALAEGILRGAKERNPVPRSTLLKAFPILSTAPETIPPESRKRAAAAIADAGSIMGLQYERGQRLVGVHSRGWILEGSNQLFCLYNARFTAVSCGTARQVIKSGLVLEVYRTSPRGHGSRNFSILGMAPARMQTVTLRTGGHNVKVPADHNAFSYHALHPIYLTASGKESHHDPPGRAERRE